MKFAIRILILQDFAGLSYLYSNLAELALPPRRFRQQFAQQFFGPIPGFKTGSVQATGPTIQPMGILVS